MKSPGLLTSIAMLSLAAASAVALAQSPKPAAPTPPAAPVAPVVAPAAAPVAAIKPAASAPTASPAAASAPASPPGPPKPPAELDQLKWTEGTWRCEGKAPAGAMGPEHGYKSTMKIKRELDGFWMAGEYEQKKSKDNPMPIKARSFLGYDPVAKKIVSVGVDNVGGALQQTGAFEADKISTSGEGSMGGQKVGFREVITKTGDRALTWHGEVRMGKDWMVIGDDTCKK
jgi:hypothetical protein